MHPKSMEIPVLQTGRLTITPITREIAGLFPEQGYDLYDHIQLHLTETDKHPENVVWGVWIVTETGTGRMVGDIGFKGKPDASGTVDIGYGFVPDVRNRGLATEAVSDLIGWAFSTGKVRRIVANCLIGNRASSRVLEKLGMQRISNDETLIYWELPRS